MKQPEKWKETIDPFTIPFKNFKLLDILGYPHARNDVFYCLGEINAEQVKCFIKYASKPDSDIKHETDTIQKLNFKFLPQIIEFDKEGKFIVTKEVEGERLSYILQNNKNEKSINYMFEYGKTLAQIHSIKYDFPEVKHRKFFDIPSFEYLQEQDIDFIYSYLVDNKPE